MLLDSFFTIIEKKQDEKGQWSYRIKLNKDHQIFGGHFPGQPISPGVCNIQMIKECAQDVVGNALKIGYIKQCKFTQLIIPTTNSELSINLNIDGEGPYTIKAQIVDGETKFMDLKADAEKE